MIMNNAVVLVRLVSFSLVAFLVGCSGSSNSSPEPSPSPAPQGVVDSTAPLVTNITLGGVAQGQVQALGLNYYIATAGVYPSSGSSANSTGEPYIGQIMIFAGDFAPAGWVLCDGSLLQISSNTVLFSVIGTIFGGDGVTTFALPDLRASVPLGPGVLTNPSNPSPSSGASSVPLITSLAWGATGQGQVTALGINYYIATQGIFPSSSGATNTTAPFLGQLMLFAGGFAPSGWALCDGSTVDISTNTPLFSILGTSFGGDGITTFALPDLRSRAAMGVGALTNPSVPTSAPGAPSVPLISSIDAGITAAGQIDAVGVGFYIATSGVFPPSSGSSISAYYVGQVMSFAGNFAPAGYAACVGSTVNISANAALFSLLGTSFGGNGTSTFALPDLRARVPMGVK